MAAKKSKSKHDLYAVVSGNIARLRGERQWTQEMLAEAMRGLGFSWKQVTVAEIEGERKNRRVTLEEWLSVAQVFEVPAVELLRPADGETMSIKGWGHIDFPMLVTFLFDPRQIEGMLTEVMTGLDARAQVLAYRQLVDTLEGPAKVLFEATNNIGAVITEALEQYTIAKERLDRLPAEFVESKGEKELRE